MKLRNESHRRRRYTFPSVAIWTAGALFLGLVLMLASIPWIARIPPGSGGMSAADADDMSFDASASINGSGVLTVFIDVPIGQQEPPEPDVQVNMPAHQMSVPVEILSAGPGAYQASAILPMPGTWEVRIQFADEFGQLELRW
ncbi:FixH family protein [Pelagibacterium sp. 26DY04]|uniref:FixH family protein n=1 Tax=Pelagibacterium sp. 26DY04 TaxID=2967130 RepID=UPI002814A585|nr:FixH family protein [Pelagibacterium sp. 26DY04]WMT86532.1 FixH family protein [Pelagibacterium sp. 26DY04]